MELRVDRKIFAMRIRGPAFNKAENAIVCAIAVVFGMFLTFLTGSLSPPDGMINPFWASVFGLGFWVLYTLLGTLPTGALGLICGLIGIILWPSFVLILLTKLLRYVQSTAFGISILFYGLFLITIIYNVPVSEVEGSPIESMPIFIKYLDFAPR